ncbi:MAG: ComEC/Rec2 family competence protein [Pseudomonadota bacterium]
MVSAWLEPQRSVLVLWTPVGLGIGIWLYFLSPVEPPPYWVGVGVAVALLPAIAFWRRGLLASTLGLAGFVLMLGFGLATLRAHLVAAPVLEESYRGPVIGRIVELSRSQSNYPRVLLDQVRLSGAAAPTRVRVSLIADNAHLTLAPGQEIMLMADLSPPGAPVEPGGFDFRRMAWFEGLGAVGYSRTPAVELERPGPAVAPGIDLGIVRLRMAIADGIRARMEARSGGFAAAILTGDRSSVDPATLSDLRASNLAHLLAISGLHMGLLTAFVFALVRYGLTVVPAIALRLPIKKIGAIAAMAAGLFYLVLSGASVATQRAFVMAAVVLVAILLDRPAVTLRAVALAATIILVVRPESMMGAGFQMSFAATTALVATFELLRHQAWWRDEGRGWVSRLRPVLALVITSAVAGAATAPFSAFHFNTMAQYGLIANLIAVPLMGMLVMPAAVIAGLLTPLGQEALALWVMGQGIDAILAIAHLVASWEGSVLRIKAGSGAVLPCLTLGAVFILLWRGRLRWLGLAPMLSAAALWLATPRPDVLITETGRLVGVLNDGVRALNRKRGEGFAARTWLENDGDEADQAGAAARGPTDRAWQIAHAGGGTIYHGAPSGDCSSTDLLLFADADPGLPCRAIARSDLERRGALAVRWTGREWRIHGARDQSTRLWQ